LLLETVADQAEPRAGAGAGGGAIGRAAEG
jgi:hypothetical protein